MLGAIPPLPQHVLMAWCLVKHRDSFTFTLPRSVDTMKPRNMQSADLFCFLRHAKCINDVIWWTRSRSFRCVVKRMNILESLLSDLCCLSSFLINVYSFRLFSNKAWDWMNDFMCFDTDPVSLSGFTQHTDLINGNILVQEGSIGVQ
jgi:hypothetical protein